jgi:hypothetical protein
MEDITVSSNLVRKVCEYMRDCYGVDRGIVCTTRKLYTIYDIPVMRKQSSLKPQVNEKRVSNVIYFHMLRELNIPSVFSEAIHSISSIDNQIVILSTDEVRSMLAEISEEEINPIDLFVSNVVLTIYTFQGYDFLVIDFISCDF